MCFIDPKAGRGSRDTLRVMLPGVAAASRVSCNLDSTEYIRLWGRSPDNSGECHDPSRPSPPPARLALHGDAARNAAVVLR